MRLVSALSAVAALLPIVTDASRLTPPVLPLIVRNPYLSTWLSDARGNPWESWPMFWTGEHVGFSVLASLPHEGTVYPLLGRPQDSLNPQDDGYNVSYPVYLGSKYDASTTNLSYAIHSHKSSKPLEITLSFLSPITPTSTLRQSIPAAYLNVFVTGHADVDIYLDVNGQWVSGDRGNKIVWDLEHTHLADGEKEAGLKSWLFRRDTEQIFTETQDQSEWGTLIFSAPSDVRHEVGISRELRQRFSRTGALQNIVDDHYRGIMEEEPVFAFAKSFRANDTSTQSHDSTKSVMFTIAHIQNPVVQFAAARGLTYLRPLWASYMPLPKDLIAFHWLDYEHAQELAYNYSAQLAVDAYKSGADDYVDIVAVSARQVMGATHFLGTPEDPLLFMKEISSDGNTQTIDVIFPAFPFFLYTNPRWLAYLLEPLIEHMLSGQYPNKYAMHDIGARYPNATGHPDGNDEYMPVEECGNILIMGLALANSIKYGTNSSVDSVWQESNNYFEGTNEKVFPLNTGSDSRIQYIDEPWNGGTRSLKQAQKWIHRSYRLWKQWTSYLVEYSLRPHNQLSTDDFAGWLALQTNLALKGIIGIKAMSGLAEIAGVETDVKLYDNTSRVYIAKWEEYGISRDKTHAKLAYDWFGSWTTTYNLYADTLLCFHLEEDASHAFGHGDQKPIGGGHKKSGFVPQHIYQLQSDWYYAVRQKYGLPLDSRHRYTKTDWEFFSMAVAAPRVRADILESVATWINETSTDRPLTDLHDTEGSGGFPGINFFARPVIGGHFAFLSLQRACGGKAMDGLKFLNDDVVDKEVQMDVNGLLELEVLEAWAAEEEL
ncbi:hypothetical protein OHC33_003907 [Knufia fluminis]|uniref:Glutaminase A n=1 Tax=Knufia fluminis TaxID=191047 RepID=A0AAN8FBK3_9EURO|nr:hypothetical protein OHC33_003907 [Knufia fluminis]